jgi:acyl-CoA synthetase (NDP forming)
MESETPTTAPSHDVIRSERQPLDAIFAPRTVAVVGASEDMGSVGCTLLCNLIGNPFGGNVYSVNPGRTSLLGVSR